MKLIASYEEYKGKAPLWYRILKKIIANLIVLLQAMGIALLIRIFIIEAYKIPTESMHPTLKVGDHLFVNKFIYGVYIPIVRVRLPAFSSPDIGDIVVFESPEYRRVGVLKEFLALITFSLIPGLDNTYDNPKNLVKRVVAKSGDTIWITNNHFLVKRKGSDRFVDISKKWIKGIAMPIYDIRFPLARYNEIKPIYDDISFTFKKYKDTLNIKYLVGAFTNAITRVAMIKGLVYEKKMYDIVEDAIDDMLDRAKGKYPPFSSYRDKLRWMIGNITNYSNIDREAISEAVSYFLIVVKQSLDEFDNYISYSKPYKIPDGYYFVMGDNRDKSLDSRYFGPVPEDKLIGAPLIRFWPPNRFGLIK